MERQVDSSGEKEEKEVLGVRIVVMVGIRIFKLNLIEGIRLVRYREVSGIPGIYIHGSLQASRWVAVKPNPISSRTITKVK